MLDQYLPYLASFVGGVVIPAILNRFGIKVPVIVPQPSQPANPDTPSPAVSAAVEWAIRARSGSVAVSAADRKALASLKVEVDQILAK